MNKNFIYCLTLSLLLLSCESDPLHDLEPSQVQGVLVTGTQNKGYFKHLLNDSELVKFSLKNEEGVTVSFQESKSSTYSFKVQPVTMFDLKVKDVTLKENDLFKDANWKFDSKTNIATLTWKPSDSFNKEKELTIHKVPVVIELTSKYLPEASVSQKHIDVFVERVEKPPVLNSFIFNSRIFNPVYKSKTSSNEVVLNVFINPSSGVDKNYPIKWLFASDFYTHPLELKIASDLNGKKITKEAQDLYKTLYLETSTNSSPESAFIFQYLHANKFYNQIPKENFNSFTKYELPLYALTPNTKSYLMLLNVSVFPVIEYPEFKPEIKAGAKKKKWVKATSNESSDSLSINRSLHIKSHIKSIYRVSEAVLQSFLKYHDVFKSLSEVRDKAFVQFINKDRDRIKSYKLAFNKLLSFKSELYSNTACESFKTNNESFEFKDVLCDCKDFKFKSYSKAKDKKRSRNQFVFEQICNYGFKYVVKKTDPHLTKYRLDLYTTAQVKDQKFDKNQGVLEIKPSADVKTSSSKKEIIDKLSLAVDSLDLHLNIKPDEESLNKVSVSQNLNDSRLNLNTSYSVNKNHLSQNFYLFSNLERPDIRCFKLKSDTRKFGKDFDFVCRILYSIKNLHLSETDSHSQDFMKVKATCPEKYADLCLCEEEPDISFGIGKVCYFNQAELGDSESIKLKLTLQSFNPYIFLLDNLYEEEENVYETKPYSLEIRKTGHLGTLPNLETTTSSEETE